jgi:farnesyl-diphosphate farnesyltransferase
MCRVADTLEDAAKAPAADRMAWLESYSDLLRIGWTGTAPDFLHAAALVLPPHSPETDLIRSWPVIGRLYETLGTRERSCLSRWISEMASGMAEFLQIEARAPGAIAFLETLEQLDRYEYCVAGTVGRMFDELIRVPGAHGESATLFGLGLQGTNILQDLSGDRRRGWCYVPAEVCAHHGLRVEQLGDPSLDAQGAAVVREMASRAASHLERGLDYVVAIPRTAHRARIFCLAPLLFALRTLAAVARDSRALHERVRVPRDQIASLARCAVASCGSEKAMVHAVAREQQALDAELKAGSAVSGIHGGPVAAAGSPADSGRAIAPRR